MLRLATEQAYREIANQDGRGLLSTTERLAARALLAIDDELLKYASGSLREIIGVVVDIVTEGTPATCNAAGIWREVLLLALGVTEEADGRSNVVNLTTRRLAPR